MASLPDGRLYTIGKSILDVLSTQLAAAGIDVPERRYVHSGQVAIDFAGTNCAEEFVVTFLQMYSGEPGVGGQTISKPVSGGVPLTAVYGVILTRCVPVQNARGIPPDHNDLDASGSQILHDTMSIAHIIADQERMRTLVPDPASLVGFGIVTPYGPEGGVGGSVTQLYVSLV